MKKFFLFFIFLSLFYPFKCFCEDPAKVKITLTESPKGLELAMTGLKKTERLIIGNPSEQLELLRFLFSNYGLMFLVSPYLPSEIETNFQVRRSTRRLINGMYKSEGLAPPKIIVAQNAVRFPPVSTYENLRTDKAKAAISYSGGKDSMYAYLRALQSFGARNVQAVHIIGLNRAVAKAEFESAKSQAKHFPIKNFVTIDLKNSSKSSGYLIMRARDLFMLAIVIPYAIEFGASQIFTEGFAASAMGDASEPYSGHETTMLLFNKILRSINLPVQIAWFNVEELDAIKALYETQPSWMPHLNNCFSCAMYFPGLRRYWAQRAPSFAAQLYPTQCGSCIKCRTTIIGRILYDPTFVASIEPADLITFLNVTEQWIKRNHTKYADFFTDRFHADFRRCREIFNLNEQ